MDKFLLCNKQKGLAPIYIAVSLLILFIIALTPIPYYFNGYCDLPCLSPSSCSCPKQGWYLGDPIWRRIVNYFIYVNKPERKTITIAPLPSPAFDETANWKTYVNTKYQYQFNFPSAFIITDGGTDKIKGEEASALVNRGSQGAPGFPIFYVDVTSKKGLSTNITSDPHALFLPK